MEILICITVLSCTKFADDRLHTQLQIIIFSTVTTHCTPFAVQVGGRSVVCKDVTQEVVILEEEQKFLKLLEVLGQFYEKGQTIIFVDKQESADSLFKVRICEEIL